MAIFAKMLRILFNKNVVGNPSLVPVVNWPLNAKVKSSFIRRDIRNSLITLKIENKKKYITYNFISRNTNMTGVRNSCPDEGSNIALGLQCLNIEVQPTSFSAAQKICTNSLGFINPPQGLIQTEILRKVK